MAKVKNPTTFSSHFGIDPEILSSLGVLDVTLAIDTKLFIDPMLLGQSQHKEFNSDAIQQYNLFFSTIIRLLSNSKMVGDVPWRNAERMLQFHEIKGTCLGYGGGSISGSGFGKKLTGKILNTASEIISIGIKDPDLFSAMALFESDIGPDRISDMTTNIISESLTSFNERILKELNLTGDIFESGVFLSHPYEPKATPIILLPKDILRDLPIASDWESVASSAKKNEDLRSQINSHVASLWTVKSKRQKGVLKLDALKSAESFGTLLKAIKNVKAAPYDLNNDPEGILNWSTTGKEFSKKFPLSLLNRKPKKLSDVYEIVKEIIQQFKHVVEHGGLNKELYNSNNKPRHESSAQRIFFAMAYSYCKANYIDPSPEIDTGNGKIDFKFSRGFNERVLVEIKLSTNSALLSGYTKQLEIYKASQETMKAVYLVLNVGQMGNKDQKLLDIKNKAITNKQPYSDIEFIDGTLKASASKRK